jgi:hypothetical protein
VYACLRHLTFAPETDPKTRYRLSSQPSICHQRGMHRSLGHLQCKAPPISINCHLTDLTQARFPFPLYLALAEDSPGLPSGQQRLGVPKVRPLNTRFRHMDPSPTLASPHSTMHSSVDFPAIQPSAAHHTIPKGTERAARRIEGKHTIDQTSTTSARYHTTKEIALQLGAFLLRPC